MSVKRTLILDFKTTGEDISKKMKQSGSAMDDFQKKANKTGKSLTKNLTAPIVGAGVAIGGFVYKMTEMGDNLAKTSQKMGIGVESLQDWNYWAEINGMSTATLERGIGRLNQRIGRAATGNDKYAKAFEDLGVSINDTEGNIRSTDDVMRDTIKSLQEIEDPALRSAAASEVFGTKLARDLMPALNDGSLSIEEATAAMDKHGRITEEQAKASEEFQDALTDLKKEFGAIFLELGMQLIPLMQDVFLPLLQEHLIPALRWLAERLQGIAEWFMELSPAWQKIILLVIGLVAALGPALVFISKLIAVGKVLAAVFAVIASPLLLKIALIAALIAGIVLLIKNFDKVRDVAVKVFKTIANVARAGIQGVLDGIFKFINNAMAIPNGLIKAANKIPRVNIPLLKFNAPQIPKLATGGIVNSATLAEIGEGSSPEAVVPLNEKGISSFVGGLNLDSTSKKNITVHIPKQENVVNLDGRTVGRMIAPEITRTVKMGGGDY